MFEKELEEYKNQSKWKGKIFMKDEETCFKDGAEFGYNKANEWHYVKNGDLSKHENYVLVSNGKDWTKGFYKDEKWNIISLVGFLHIIAWKEIELPKGE